MGCKQGLVKEEKRIMAYFIALCKFIKLFILYFLDLNNESMVFNILSYDQCYQFLSKNSANNFKRLERKQLVRLGFIEEVGRYIFHLDICEKERDE